MVQPEQFLITIQYPTEDRGFANNLRIDQNGVAHWSVQSNSLHPEGPSVGLYQTNIDPQSAVEFRSTLEMLDKRGLPPHIPLPPGEDLPVVSLEVNGLSRSERIDPQSTSPAICKVAEHFKGVILQALRNPIQTITLKTSVNPNVLSGNQPLSLVFILEAAGTENVQVAYPVPKDSKSGGVVIWAIRSDIPVVDRWPQHSKQITLTAEHLIQQNTAPSDDENHMVLSPGQNAQFNCSIPISWEPGMYDLRIIYVSNSSDKSILNGRITTKPVPLAIRLQ